MEQNELPGLPQPASPPSSILLVESLLFVAAEPVAVSHLARVLELPADTVEAALSDLQTAYGGRGIRLQRQGDRVQLVSAPEAAASIARFLGVQANTRLSTAALEVLAIIAYRQPLTRSQIEGIRGVDSSGIVRQLLARDLIAEAGRLEAVGRPILYVTTPLFLQQFGLTALSELPAIELPEAPTLAEGAATPVLHKVSLLIHRHCG
ncbi:SMC-Scp complex subunit ScpB [Candidatus Gracilibacteria bacterium]|nr:SMC-Scp complex subunit ScpB [Candidatus Gracilibacteria bacterium]